MNMIINIAESAFKLVAQTTWQATVVAGLILLAQWLFRKRLTPAWRYGLWFLLIARLLMPASFPSALSIFNLAKVKAPTPYRDLAQPTPPVSPNSYPMATANQPNPVSVVPTYSETLGQKTIERSRPPTPAKTQVYEPSRRQSDWLAFALLLWLSGVCVLGLRMIWSNLRFSSRLAHHPRIEDGPILRLFDDCASALGFRGHVNLIETDEVESPAVYGLWRKRVLLPEGFSERFSRAELRCVFMHELAHIKRYDLEINWLVSVLQVLHWFNPALWFAFARMRADRELACDALALLRMGEDKRFSYGETILKLLESLDQPSAVPGLLGISEDKRRMKQRIRVIANFKRPSRWSAAALLLAVGLGIVGLTDANNGGSATLAATGDQSGDKPRDRSEVQQATSPLVSQAEHGFPPFMVEANVTSAYFRPNQTNATYQPEWGVTFYYSNGWWQIEAKLLNPLSPACPSAPRTQSSMKIPDGVREFHRWEVNTNSGRSLALATPLTFPLPGDSMSLLPWLSFSPHPALPLIDGKRMRRFLDVQSSGLGLDLLKDPQNEGCFTAIYLKPGAVFLSELNVTNNGVSLGLGSKLENEVKPFPAPFENGFLDFRFEVLATTNCNGIAFPIRTVLKRFYPNWHTQTADDLYMGEVSELVMKRISFAASDLTNRPPSPPELAAFDHRPPSLSVGENVYYTVINDVWQSLSDTNNPDLARTFRWYAERDDGIETVDNDLNSKANQKKRRKASPD